MLLNADILFDCLSESVSLTEYGRRRPELALCRPVFYTGHSDQFERNRLYLALSEDLPKLPQIAEGVVFLCLGGTPPSPYTTGRCCTFVVTDETDLLTLMNLTHQIFDRFDAWERNLGAILTGDLSIQRLVDASEAVLGNPISVIDPDYRFYAYSASIDRRDDLAILRPDSDGKYDPDFLCASIAAIDTNMSKVEPFLVDAQVLGGKVFSINLFVRGNYAGNLKVAFVLRPWRKSDNILCQHLAKCVEKALEKHTTMAKTGADTIREIYLALIKGEPLSRVKQQYLLAGSPNGQYVCMRFVLGERSLRKVPTTYICDHIESLFRGCIAFPYDSTIVAIVDLHQSGLELLELGDQVKSLLKAMNLKVGISNVYDDLRSTRSYFREACVAFELGSTLDPNWSYYRFADYTLRYMMYSCMGEFTPEMLYTQGFRRLLEYDKSSQVSHVQTLRIYLDNNMNLAQTAKDLYIHRTTLQERLRKIEGLLGIDLKDPDQRLQLSIILKISQIREAEGRTDLQQAPKTKKAPKTPRSIQANELTMNYTELEKLL